jgi:hypothetical protein
LPELEAGQAPVSNSEVNYGFRLNFTPLFVFFMALKHRRGLNFTNNFWAMAPLK